MNLIFGHALRVAWLSESYPLAGRWGGALAHDLGMRPLMAHCHLNLGRLERQRRQRQQSRAELSTARELYRAMAMTFWLPQLEAELAQLP